MKAITVGQLRQNPTPMLDDIAAGASYVITRHRRVIGKIVPADSQAELIPAKRHGRSSLAIIPRHELTTASSIAELIDDMRGAW
ncbi:type II toxin-antitoxin system Phd/YefM family antitoxin [Propionimicrobium sp. PCR01-08-3]|uniref:type II toxin-antitoxin system Phd/YefM family antitoxin n=1 Tax=Propionimicrobium sp. PCR01-08-3 TaxID=3052086 RepID=UPI00255CEAAA|nr:type II toxin-antitoxin system Phd/YefM family antitoxin [Propionimicrobium sp. PCR01-08-3]WIY83681.1 type II toxin-antitoxin system Phd/YefM family antitoxin [Propionimicrobium sp. PCR01-08-3]